MNEYVTLTFVNGSALTRKISDLHPLSNYTNNLIKAVPSGPEVLINWDAVAWIEPADYYAIEMYKYEFEKG